MMSFFALSTLFFPLFVGDGVILLSLQDFQKSYSPVFERRYQGAFLQDRGPKFGKGRCYYTCLSVVAFGIMCTRVFLPAVG